MHVSLEEYKAMWDKYVAKVLEGKLTIKQATLEIKMHEFMEMTEFSEVEERLKKIVAMYQEFLQDTYKKKK